MRVLFVIAAVFCIFAASEDFQDVFSGTAKTVSIGAEIVPTNYRQQTIVVATHNNAAKQAEKNDFRSQVQAVSNSLIKIMFDITNEGTEEEPEWKWEPKTGFADGTGNLSVHDNDMTIEVNIAPDDEPQEDLVTFPVTNLRTHVFDQFYNFVNNYNNSNKRAVSDNVKLNLVYFKTIVSCANGGTCKKNVSTWDSRRRKL